MRFLFSIASTCALFYGGYYFYQNHPDVVENAFGFFRQHLPTGEFQTLEIRYSADQVIGANRRVLVKDKRHTLLEPQLRFYPYVLLEVKYSTPKKKTAEGVILWSLVDGEMVIDTNKWAKTHGYEDCLNAHATKAEFLILNILAQNGGEMEKSRLLAQLRSVAKNSGADALLHSCQRKKLIVQQGNLVRLHFADPRLTQHPITHVSQWLVTKPYRDATCIKKKYSISQIKSLATAAFGHDFAIRRTLEVYLPVYEIEVKNPDQTVMTTHWNAVTGTQITSPYAPPQKGEVLNLTDLLPSKK